MIDLTIINSEWMMIPLVLVSAMLGAVAVLLLKIGSKKFRIRFSLRFVLEVLNNHPLIYGLVIYGISTLIFILALRLGELSVVYPMASVSYIFACLLSIYFLKEKMNWYKWLGIGLVMLGAILVKL